jgi:PqqD family protein of HPr-rel-A system
VDNILIQKLLQAQLKTKKEIEISVTGVSMNPTLFEGDVITGSARQEYEVGDIVILTYKQRELLVHRILRIKNDRYFCKGDNSFRLEDITFDQILGKVILRNGDKIEPPPAKLITLSYLINRVFLKCRYDVEKAKQTNIYRLYEKTILRKERNIMIYKKNENMDYIQTDETSLAVFDPDSGDTHLFDETGIEILNALSEPCDLDTLLDRLCKLYNTTPNEIKDDVLEFLAETILKKVVEEM